MSTKLSPGTRPVTSRCVLCGAGTAIVRIFMGGPRYRYRTWRFVDYARPVNRETYCPDCGGSSDAKVTVERKKRPEPRPEIVAEIKRLKRLGYIMFEGDRRW